MIRHNIPHALAHSGADLYAESPPQHVLQDVNQAVMVGLMQQLGQVVTAAQSVFDKLRTEVEAVGERMGNVQQRVQGLQATVQEVDKAVTSAPDATVFLGCQEPFDMPDTLPPPMLFQPETRDAALQEVFARCTAPPPLSVMDAFDPSGVQYAHRYSDPYFFFNQWSERELQTQQHLEMKQQQQQQQRRQEQQQQQQVDQARSPLLPSASAPAAAAAAAAGAAPAAAMDVRTGTAVDAVRPAVVAGAAAHSGATDDASTSPSNVTLRAAPAREALLGQIHGFNKAALRPSAADEAPEAPAAPARPAPVLAAAGAPRVPHPASNLLQQIRTFKDAGQSLRRVEPVQSPSKGAGPPGLSGMSNVVDILMRRRSAIAGDAEENGSESEWSEEDW